MFAIRTDNPIMRGHLPPMCASRGIHYYTLAVTLSITGRRSFPFLYYSGAVHEPAGVFPTDQ
jgi:hypothetical protein